MALATIAPMNHFTWTGSRSYFDEPECNIWFGETNEPEFVECACFDLYHEEDYWGICDQLIAEELGYTEMNIA